MKIRKGNFIFLCFGIWFLLITFIGFAPSFYLRNKPEHLSWHLIIHGIVFSLWILFFLVQTSLVFIKKIKLHMTLGIVGLVLILIMIPTGIYPILYKVAIGTKTIDHAGHNLFGLLAGFTFFFLGYFNRKNLFRHKRFMLFATIMLTTAAIDRIVFGLQMEDNLFFRKGLVLLPALIMFTIDIKEQKKFIGFDLIPVVVLMSIYYLADYFWLSSLGENTMNLLVKLI